MDNLAVFPNIGAIKEEAGAWVVRLDRGDMGAKELRELRLWMQRSDFHREYLLKLTANWDAMGALRELGEMFPLPEKETSAASRSGLAGLFSRIREYFQFPSAVLASGLVAVLMVVALLANTAWFTGMPGEYVTAIGERQSYILDDGTVVALNTNTRIRVDYTDARRAITLVQGEAGFDVAKNPERPFVVYAGTGLVWAVGTAFNVRYQDTGLVDVIVTEGRVKVFSDAHATDVETPSLESLGVSAADEKNTAAIVDLGTAVLEQSEALLGAGESLRYRQVIEDVKPMLQEESSRILAWREGSLVFKGETLEQAVAEISRYTDKELVISDANLKALRVGGHYKTDDIDALLASLGQGLGIVVNYAEKDRVFLSASAN